MKLFSSKILLYLSKITARPYMEYFSQVWTCKLKFCLVMLDKLQKWVCKDFGRLDPMAHC